jgi:hypothetical protein
MLLVGVDLVTNATTLDLSPTQTCKQNDGKSGMLVGISSSFQDVGVG